MANGSLEEGPPSLLFSPDGVPVPLRGGAVEVLTLLSYAKGR